MTFTLRTQELDRLLIINQVIQGQMSQVDASHILNLSPRQMRRLVKRVKADGFSGVKPRHKGSNRLFCTELKDKIMWIVRTKYSDFGPTFACEKLLEEGYKVSKETLRHWMMSDGLWKGKKRKMIRCHQSRERRPRFGELVQIDGSHHDWFEGRRDKCCLLVFIDDATSQIIGARFEESETTLGYMRLVKDHIQTLGRPIAYYSDRHSIFKTTRENVVDGKYPDTQFVRALRTMNIELICAHSPQAKGRVERAHKTLQDRLIKEMRLEEINTIEKANAYLPAFIKKYYDRFAVQPLTNEDAHRPNPYTQEHLNQILSIQETRRVSKNLEFSFESKTYQITTQNVANRLKHKTVSVCQMMDGQLLVTREGMNLSFTIQPKQKRNLQADTKEINNMVDQIVNQSPLNKIIK